MRDIRKQARFILERHWGYQFPVDVFHIAQNMDIRLEAINEENSSLAGEFFFDDEGIPVCRIRESDRMTRKRFTLAHEIGHYVLGHGPAFRDSDLVFDTFNYDMREVEANIFAAELLMPEKAVEYLIEEENIYSPAELASIFDVSLQAMNIRLRNLGW